MHKEEGEDKNKKKTNPSLLLADWIGLSIQKGFWGKKWKKRVTKASFLGNGDPEIT